MAPEKVRVTPEVAETLREQVEDGKREGFGNVADRLRGTSATVTADDSAFLKFGAVEHDSRTE